MNIKGLTLLLCLLFATTVQAGPQKPGPDNVDSESGPPIVLTLFLHDQLDPMEIAGLGPDYLEWFIKELTQVTGRRVNVVSLRHIPGVTDFGYRQGDELKAMSDWRLQVVNYIEANNLPLSTQRHKYLLITRHNISAETLGIAYTNSGVAIASIKAYSTIGHEIGHMLGATHEKSETRFASGLPCRTLMYPEHTALFANCFVFSDANRQAVHEYVNGKTKR